MRQVGSDTRCVYDIVERKLVNELAVLEEKRERLLRGQSLPAASIATRRRSSLVLTCPMPPDAPATTALTIVTCLCGVWSCVKVVVVVFRRGN